LIKDSNGLLQGDAKEENTAFEIEVEVLNLSFRDAKQHLCFMTHLFPESPNFTKQQLLAALLKRQTKAINDAVH
jgi:hypothetical protein